MPSFWKRFLRSGFGTTTVIRRVDKRIKARRLRQILPLRSGPPYIKSKKELMALMADHPYIDDAEILLLSRYASAAKCIVEIGSAFGASAAIFLANTSTTAEIHSIDPFVEDSMAPFRATEAKCRKNVRRVLAACGKREALARWHLHTDFSYTLAPGWSQPIDLIFIDGDHTYEAVRKDFEDWLPHVRQGGFILFHDSRREPGAPDNIFKRGWPGPTRLAEELRHNPSVRPVEEVFSITVWQKN